MKLTASQINMSYLATVDGFDEECEIEYENDTDFDDEVLRRSLSRKEIRSKGDRERGEIILHDGKSCKQVRKY